MSYSFDVIKKMAFTKEIEKIDNGYRVDVGNMPLEMVKKYLEHRIKEIDEEYGEPRLRD